MSYVRIIKKLGQDKARDKILYFSRMQYKSMCICVYIRSIAGSSDAGGTLEDLIAVVP